MQTNQRAPRLVLRGALPPLERLLSPGAPTPPAWELTFISNGKTFKALQRGRNAQAAAAEAVMELALQCWDFDATDYRMLAAVQTL
jgi:hypothetical protein